MREPVVQTPDVPTQRDVASRLGISNATVSLALRDHPRIPVTTRERIKRMADEMGYQPIPMLRILSNYKNSSKQRARLLILINWPLLSVRQVANPNILEFHIAASTGMQL